MPRSVLPEALASICTGEASAFEPSLTRRRFFSGVVTGLAALGVVGPILMIMQYRARKSAALSDRQLGAKLDRAGDVEGQATRVYLVGDSQIAHWPMHYRSDWVMFRSGFPGEATPNIVAAVQPLLSLVRPDVMIVISGGNDASGIAVLPVEARPAMIRRCADAFRALIDGSLATGAQQIYVSRLPEAKRGNLLERIVRGSAIDAVRRSLNSELVRVCAGRCRLVSLGDLLGIGQGGDWSAYLTDHVHLNDAAYERLTRAFDVEIRKERSHEAP